MCLLTSERGLFCASLSGGRFRYRVPSKGQGKVAAGDKFRVSGTKGMVEVAGANKESGGRFAH